MTDLMDDRGKGASKKDKNEMKARFFLYGWLILTIAGLSSKLAYAGEGMQELTPVTHDNVFAMHFEPQNANEDGFRRFHDRVIFARERRQKFTLAFSPPWVEMILADPGKTAFVRRLFNEGWDMAPHHHGPHHSGAWDGYTAINADRSINLRIKFYRNNPYPDIIRWYREKERYKGNMKDFVAFMNKLYPFKVIGAMGGDRDFDWPEGISFSMDNAVVSYPSGKIVFDAPNDVRLEETTGITQFIKKDYNTHTVYECGMRFLANRAELKEAKREYENLQKTGKKGEFMAVVLHLADDEGLFREWIEYLYERDPQGIHNKTITALALSLPRGK